MHTESNPLWKIEVLLYERLATGIIVDGTNVYVSGFVGSPLGMSYTTAAYWGNGTLSRLSSLKFQINPFRKERIFF
jgi:hypothetical protein